MTYRLPIERRTLWRRRLVLLLAMLLALVVATWLDRITFRALFVGHDSRARLESRDWYQFLRAVGFLPTWIVLWLGAWLASDNRRMARGRDRAALVLAPLLAGFLAEAFKLVLSRQRPINNGIGDGAYVLNGLFSGFWASSNLGLPSSHAAVAAGGATALIAWRPGLWPLAAALAAGCMATRLLSGAHFLSDVALGAILGYVAWRLVRPGGWRGQTRAMLLP